MAWQTDAHSPSHLPNCLSTKNLEAFIKKPGDVNPKRASHHRALEQTIKTKILLLPHLEKKGNQA
jgi:hypothetical protein